MEEGREENKKRRKKKGGEDRYLLGVAADDIEWGSSSVLCNSRADYH